MPENIEGLLADLGVSSQQTDPTDTNTNTQETNTATTATSNADEGAQANQAAQTTEPAQQSQDGNTQTQGTTNVDAQLEQQKANQAFASMRADNTKYKKFIQTLMKGSNFVGDEAAFIQALEDEAYKQQAKLQGMAANPEILRKVDQQAEQIKELTQSQKDQTLMLGLKTLQQTNNLTGAQVEAFVKGAIDNRIDLYTPGLSYDMLYKGMFFDKIVEERIEAARQDWIKQSNKSASAATPDNKSGKKESAPTDIKTMAEFNSLLNNVPKDLK